MTTAPARNTTNWLRAASSMNEALLAPRHLPLHFPNGCQYHRRRAHRQPRYRGVDLPARRRRWAQLLRAVRRSGVLHRAPDAGHSRPDSSDPNKAIAPTTCWPSPNLGGLLPAYQPATWRSFTGWWNHLQHGRTDAQRFMEAGKSNDLTVNTAGFAAISRRVPGPLRRILRAIGFSGLADTLRAAQDAPIPNPQPTSAESSNSSCRMTYAE
jgi:hypothetical protein